MSKWCSICRRNDILNTYQSCSSNCPVFGKYFDELAEIILSNKANKAYLICYSTEYGTYTSHIVFTTRNLAEKKCIELKKEDGLDWYVVEVPLVTN